MILVTGSTGFVGRRVVAELKAQGQAVRCLVRTPAHRGTIATDGVEVCYGDVLNTESLASAMEGVSGVVHLVGVIRERGDLTFASVNHEGTRNVVEATRATGVQQLVYLSGIGAADDPRLAFLRSKWQAEQEVINGGVPYTILRASLLFGEGDEFFNVLAGVAKAMPVTPVAGDGEATFQPLAVEELARCIAQCFEREELVGQILEVGGPEHLTYNQLVDLIMETLGVRRVKMHLPLTIMRRVVQVLERVVPRPPATSNQLEMLSIPNTTNLDGVERWFGFRPRTVRGNIDYIRRISYGDALRTVLGFLPSHIRDH